jgi:O-antigen/teichoic acid export membrane protein
MASPDGVEIRTGRTALIVQTLRGLELASQFLLAILAAREIGAEQFGAAGVLVSIQTIVAVCGACGFDELVQRAVAQSQGSLASVLDRALRARLVAAFLVTAIGLLAILAVPSIRSSDYFYPVCLLTLWTFGTIISNLYLSAAISLGKVSIPLSASLLSWAMPVGLTVVGCVHDLTSYAGVLALGAVVRLAITLTWAAIRMDCGSRISATMLLRSNNLLLGSFRTHASIVLYNLNNQVLGRHGDILIAGALGLSLASIGAYGLAFQIAATANTFLMIGLGAVAFSKFSAYAHDERFLGAAWRKQSAVAALIAVGPLSVLPLVIPELASLAFSSEYPELQSLVACLCAAQWVNRLTGGGTNIGALLALGQATYVARTSIAGGCVNVILNLCLAPAFGVYGLVMGSGIALGAVGIMNTMRLRRTLGANPPVLILVLLSPPIMASASMTMGHVEPAPRWALGAVIALIWTGALLHTFTRREIW